MGAGLDSISAVELVSQLGKRLGTEIEPTALFDYPTIASLNKYFKTQMEPDFETPQSVPILPRQPRVKVNVAGVVQKTVHELLGIVVPNDTPLMGAGIDSISAVELVSTLGSNLGTELEPTALFDYPTIDSLSRYLNEHMEPERELAQESKIVPIASQLDAEGKTTQECFVVATAMYLPTVE